MNELRNTKSDGKASLAHVLSASSPFSDDELEALGSVRETRMVLDEGEAVFRSGDVLTKSYLVLSGWIGRVYTSTDGESRTINIYLPGDLIVVHHGFKQTATIDAIALTPAEIALIAPEDLASLPLRFPKIGDAIGWQAIRAMNIVSMQVASASLRSSSKRIMHQLLELWSRLIPIGLATDDGFHLPLSQRALGQLCGLSVVSVNRALSSLKRQGLLLIERRRVIFPLLRNAIRFADFDPLYLEPYRTARTAA